MTHKYDISQFHWSWCLNDRLDFSNRARWSDVGQNWMNRCDCWGPDGQDTKIDQSDKCHICMSYASYDIKCHIMTNDAYDSEIWHKSIWSILVSKEAARPQHSHQLIPFWLKNYFEKFVSQNRMNGCDCWGPDGRLDTKIDQFDLCHMRY